VESYERNGCAVARDPAFAKEALGPVIHSHAGVPGRSFLYREKMTFSGARKLWGRWNLEGSSTLLGRISLVVCEFRS
jgi:hypothetical protein